jgi:hypothetical protein
MSTDLGNSLNVLVIAHNFARSGWHVEIYGKHAWSLARWFPHLSIKPALLAEEARIALANFGTVVHMHQDRPLKDLSVWHPGFMDLHDIEYAHRSAAEGNRHVDRGDTRCCAARVR